MSLKGWRIWFSVVSVIAILWGVLFTVFGLGILPLKPDVLLRWEGALYGAILVGWGVTLFLAGRIALRRNDEELIRAILIGLMVWLLIEAVFSARLRVWFNVGVDAVVFALFAIPLRSALRLAKHENEKGKRVPFSSAE